jgi:hypothetical protein
MNKRPIDCLDTICPNCIYRVTEQHFSHGRKEEIEEWVCKLGNFVGVKPCKLWHWQSCPLRNK